VKTLKFGSYNLEGGIDEGRDIRLLSPARHARRREGRRVGAPGVQALACQRVRGDRQREHGGGVSGNHPAIHVGAADELRAVEKGAAVMRRNRRFRVLRAAALAVTVLAAPACGAPRTLAPGQPGGISVRAACARPAPAMGAGQLRAAYQAPTVSAGAVTGAGTVIAVIIPSAAPHVAADLAVYSRRYGLPAPRVRVLSYGRVPSPSGADAAGWQQEGTVDLEMAHALAPQAQLAYLAVPPGGDGAAPEDAALDWLVTRYRITVVSYSSGFPEAWYARQGYTAITASRAGLEAAARAGTTVVASAGDHGPAEPDPSGHLQRSVAWPASDPLATAVGGTRLTAPAAGRAGYASTAFSYTAGRSGGRAGGAGLSAVFARPAWQDQVAAVTGSRRGVADIAMDASDCSPVAAYTSTSDLPGRHPGWITFAGTSVAAPLFAGVVADAAQAAGHPLGVLGPALYQLHGRSDGITDVTSGSNSMPGLPGYAAHPGYDLLTGVGTISSITLFSNGLARTARRHL
jgi:subtilase family serine protease